MLDTERQKQLIDKVEALFAKARSTTFEAEAEAFEAKAWELIAKHGIDEAKLNAGDRADEIVSKLLTDIKWAMGGYGRAQRMIFSALAKSQNVRFYAKGGSQGRHEFHQPYVVGFASDIDRLQVLYTTTLSHCMAAAAKVKGTRLGYARYNWHTGQRSTPTTAAHTKQLRRSFIVGFAAGLGEKLGKATDNAQADHGSNNLPAIIERKQQVDGAYRDATRGIRLVRAGDVGGVDSGAYGAGVSAAGQANVHTGLAGRMALGAGR